MKITEGVFLTKIPNLDQSISILIVEDETVLALGMEFSLEEFGYDVSGIESTALGAIEHVKDNKIDLILMDIKLKGEQSGIDAANIIWKQYQIPVIFLTSYSDNQTMKNAMNSEPYAYLLKPCRDEELKVAIKTTLHKHNYFFKNKETIKVHQFDSPLIACEYGFIYDKHKNILLKDTEVIELTGKEIKLFEILCEFMGEPVSFERINQYIWRDESSDLGRLRTLIYRIKVKLGVHLIENLFEMGYRLKIQ